MPFKSEENKLNYKLLHMLQCREISLFGGINYEPIIYNVNKQYQEWFTLHNVTQKQ